MTPILTDRQQQAATILEKAVCLSLWCHYLGNNRKVDLETLVHDAVADDATLTIDKNQFHATKRLIDTKELRPVLRVLGRVKQYLRSVAIAANTVFGERSYLVPTGLVEIVDAQLVTFSLELATEAAALAGRYEAAVAAQRVALGPQFHAGDYVGADAVAEAFGLDWSYVSFAAPENLESISHVLAARADAKHRAKLAQAYDEVLVGLRASALEVLSDLVTKLGPGADGKPRVLRGTALQDLQDFVAYLPHRNLTGDDALAAVMGRITARAAGLDVDDLRDSPALRAGMLAAASEAKAALAELVEVGRRGIRLAGQPGVQAV